MKTPRERLLSKGERLKQFFVVLALLFLATSCIPQIPPKPVETYSFSPEPPTSSTAFPTSIPQQIPQQIINIQTTTFDPQTGEIMYNGPLVTVGEYPQNSCNADPQYFNRKQPGNDMRATLCYSINNLLLYFISPNQISKEMIERIAAKIIITDGPGINTVCEELVPGCTPLSGSIIFINEQNIDEEAIIAHELTHLIINTIPDGSYVLDEEHNVCYQIKDRIITVTYTTKDGERKTHSFHPEFFPTLIEGSILTLAYPESPLLPGYLQKQNIDDDTYEKMMEEFYQAFSGIQNNPSTNLLLRYAKGETPQLWWIVEILNDLGIERLSDLDGLFQQNLSQQIHQEPKKTH